MTVDPHIGTDALWEIAHKKRAAADNESRHLAQCPRCRKSVALLDDLRSASLTAVVQTHEAPDCISDATAEALVSRELGPERAQRIEEHIMSCSRCLRLKAAAVRKAREHRGAAGAVPSPDVISLRLPLRNLAAGRAAPDRMGDAGGDSFDVSRPGLQVSGSANAISLRFQVVLESPRHEVHLETNEDACIALRRVDQSGRQFVCDRVPRRLLPKQDGQPLLRLVLRP